MGEEDLASNMGSSGEYWLRQSEVEELPLYREEPQPSKVKYLSGGHACCNRFCNLIVLNCSDKRRWITFTCQRGLGTSRYRNDGLLAKETVNCGWVRTHETFVGYSTVLLAVIYAVGGSCVRLVVRDEVWGVIVCNTKRRDHRSRVHPKVRIQWYLG